MERSGGGYACACLAECRALPRPVAVSPARVLSAGDLGDTTAFMLATSRQSDVSTLSHHHSPVFPLCGGTWQLRLTVDGGSAAQNAVPMVGVHAILVEQHRCAAGPTTANFTLRLEAERDPPAVGSSHEYHHVGKSFGVGTG